MSGPQKRRNSGAMALNQGFLRPAISNAPPLRENQNGALERPFSFPCSLDQRRNSGALRRHWRNSPVLGVAEVEASTHGQGVYKRRAPSRVREAAPQGDGLLRTWPRARARAALVPPSAGRLAASCGTGRPDPGAELGRSIAEARTAEQLIRYQRSGSAFYRVGATGYAALPPCTVAKSAVLATLRLRLPPARPLLAAGFPQWPGPWPAQLLTFRRWRLDGHTVPGRPFGAFPRPQAAVWLDPVAPLADASTRRRGVFSGAEGGGRRGVGGKSRPARGAARDP